MPAPLDNQFWKARRRHGRPKRFTPDKLWEACCEYFSWVDYNPLWEARPFHYQGEITYAAVPKMRAMTIDGLCLFLLIDPTTWRQWRRDEDLSPVVTRVEMVIRDQKFSGAAAGLFNARIIAHDLGMT